jgi:hypothetical protein
VLKIKLTVFKSGLICLFIARKRLKCIFATNYYLTMNNAVAGFSKLSKEEKLIGLPKNTFLLQRSHQIIEELLEF